ncbi:MAG: hypothetical protein NZT61_01625 [Deltaproteobacteria bacterium]|nr:hypothetical protein [Deltaproteobacteria bacterium]
MSRFFQRANKKNFLSNQGPETHQDQEIKKNNLSKQGYLTKQINQIPIKLILSGWLEENPVCPPRGIFSTEDP